MFAGLDPTTLADKDSWASLKLAAVQAAYDASISGGYQVSGQYIDSVLAFNSEFGGNINYRASSLATTSHPPVFDRSGTIGVLGAAEELSFLLEVGRTVRGRGQHLFGNGHKDAYEWQESVPDAQDCVSVLLSLLTKIRQLVSARTVLLY